MKDLTLKQIPNEKFNITILVISSNNLFHFTSLSDFKNNTKKVLGRYSKISDKLILIGPGRVFDAKAIPLFLKPMYKAQGEKYARIIDEEAKNYANVFHVNPLNTSINPQEYGDTNASDGFHPNDEGHRFWFSLLKPFL